MKNNWSNSEAQKYIKKFKKLGHSKDMALRVYTTRLLGRNSELVLHGGGNTSVKTSIKDIDGNITAENAPQGQANTDEKETWEKTGTENVYQGIDLAKIVPLLVKTIQELEARIITLEGA